MAPRKQVPVKALIDGLFNKLGVQPLPSHSDIRVEVGKIRQRYAELEDIPGAPDLIAQNEDLKAKLEAKEKELEATKSDAKAQIDILRTELDALRKEQVDHKTKQPELPKEQFWILEALPIESVGCLNALQIAEKADLPVNEVDVHLAQLSALAPNLAKHTYDQPKNWKWFCTTEGTKYLMAVKADNGQLARYERTPRLHFEDENLLRVVEKLGGSSAANIELRYRGRGRAGGVSDDIIRRLSGLRSRGIIGANNLDKHRGSWFILELGLAYFREHRGPRPENK